MTTPKERIDVDLRSYLRILWGFRWLVAATTVIVAAIVFVWTLQQPRIYEATTTVEFDPNPVGPLGSEVEDVADPMGGFWSTREFMATQIRVLASRSVAERVVERLALHEDPTFAANRDFPISTTDAANLLLDRLSVNAVKDTRLVELRVRGENPDQVSAIADAWADVYIEKTLEDRMGSTVTALDWLGNQLDSLRRELESSELALHEFKQAHNILSVSMEDRQNLVAQEIESFNTALTQARQRRIEVSARVRRLQAALGSDPLEASGTVFDQRSALQDLRERLRTKEALRDSQATQRGPNHPAQRALEQEVSALRTQLSAEVQTIVANAEADLREIRAVEQGLHQAWEGAHDAGLELNLREIEYQRLNRARENKSKVYSLLLERTTETDLTRMVQATPVRILDRALIPQFPVAPNRTANGLAGILAGLLLGVALAFAVRRLDRRLRNPEMVEALGVTVLGVIPEVEGTNEEPVRGVRSSAADLVVHSMPMSKSSECIRTVRTNLTFMAVGSEESRVLAITSSHPREGKTMFACNLAASMAQSGKRVLLVDTDLRRARIHNSFRLSRELGVSAFIVGEATFPDIVQASHIPGLDVIVAGPVPPNPAELLHSKRFVELIAAARSRYDIVIFDSPPLGAVTDAAVLAPQVDGVVLVVKARETTREALRLSLRQLKDVGARVLGAVLNGLDFSAEGYGGYYYYQKYGEYYSSEEIVEDAPA